MSDKKSENYREMQQPEPSRRTFLNKLWLLLGAVGLLEIVWAVLAYFRSIQSRSASEGHGLIVEAGPVETFTAASVTAFVRGRFYLCRLEDGGFLAVSRTCTHLGCTVPWEEKQMRFVCPCHGSAFDIRGVVTHPPAVRPLDIYGLFIENNIVKVDTGRRIKRSGFAADQVVYAEKT